MTPTDKAQAHLHRLDIVVKAVEIRWGVCFGVQAFVPPELWQKFDRQWSALNAAITENRHEDVVTLADGAVRGVWALDKAAWEAGHSPPPLPAYGQEHKTPVDPAKIENKGIAELGSEFWRNGGDALPF